MPNSPDTPDAKLFFPATQRNREVIAQHMRPRIAGSKRVLEIASGSGEHITFFARHFASEHPELRWQPTDIDAAHIASTDAWVHELGLQELIAPAILLDVHLETWPEAACAQVDAIFCANMIHIAPPSAAAALLEGAARVLPSGGKFLLYGPFVRNGEHTAPSNEAFDARLKARDPGWGVRDLDELTRRAAELGLERTEICEMPANNLLVEFARA